MKTINTYILEKLRINKDSHIERGFKSSNDNFSILSIYYNNSFDKDVTIDICQPYKIKSIDDNKIVYFSVFDDKREMSVDYYINSKGYYQHDLKESSGKSAGRIYQNEIYMHPDEYKSFIELILKEKVFNPKYSEEGNKKIVDLLINNYFDNVNIDELKERNLKYYDSTHKGVIMPIERPKELKEILTGYYAKY